MSTVSDNFQLISQHMRRFSQLGMPRRTRCLLKTLQRLIRGRRQSGMENNGERSDARVECVGEIILPCANRSEDSLNTTLLREILSASIPDLADNEVLGAYKHHK